MSALFDPSVLREMGVLDPSMLIALASVALGGALRGFTGFGGALVIVPILSIIFTPREAVAMHSVLEIPGLLLLMPTAVRHADRSCVVPMILALIIATPVGVGLLVSINPDIMRIVISVMVLMMVALIASNWRYSGPVRLPVSLGTGTAGGVIQGLTGIGGPVIVTVLMARDDVSDTIRANIIAMMGSLVIVALPILWAYGLLTPRVLIVGAISGPVYLGSISLGSRYYAGSGKEFHRAVSLTMLAVIGVSTLIAALLK